MQRSFLASWLDRSSIDASTTEDLWSSTVTLCLTAMVWKAVHALSCDGQPVHSPPVTELFSLAVMMVMFIGEHEPKSGEMAKALGRHCAEQDWDACLNISQRFHNLRIANNAYKLDKLHPTELAKYRARAALLRQNMREAVQHML
jgi:hypothetical protein